MKDGDTSLCQRTGRRRRDSKGAKTRCRKSTRRSRVCIFKGLANRSLRSDMSFQAHLTWRKGLTVHVFMFCMRVAKALTRLHKCADSSELSLLVLAIKTTANCCLCLLNIHVHVY